MDFKKLTKEFKDMAEMQEYADAQFKVITDLNKKLNKIEEENKHLKILLEKSTPVLVEDAKNFLTYSPADPNEKLISEAELKKLKDISFERALTYEEAKRVDIYAKILASLKEKNKSDINPNFKNYTDIELLKIVTDEPAK